MPSIRPLLCACAVLTFACAANAESATTLGFKTVFDHIDKSDWTISHGWANGDHQSCEWRSSALSIENDRLLMTLSDNGGSKRPIGCPEIHTKQRLGYGVYEAKMRSAAGSGLNTAFFTYIGPPAGVPEHDEIDFEFLGKDPTTVQVNTFVKGKPLNTKTVQLGFDASKDFHTYAIDWSPLKIRWYVDGKLVHETAEKSPLPKNPGSLFFSLWSNTKGLDAWMGPFHYAQPVTAEVEWVSYTPMTKACLFPESITCQKR